MPCIHPTAIVDDRVEMADDVEIGPYSILEGRITIGAGSRVRSHVFLQGPLTLGEGNDIWPFASIGAAPQTSHFDPDSEGSGTVVGDKNIFREHSSIHRAIHETEPTRIGSNNLFMDSAHAGHDCQVGDNAVFSKGTALAGHVTIENNVIIGGGSMIHQFSRIGRGAFIGGGQGLAKDLLPWFMTSRLNFASGINTIGMKRNGFTSEDVDVARWVYRVICRMGLSIKSARELIEERKGHALIDEYLTFLDNSTRAICTAKEQRTMTDKRTMQNS
jgi:UDP-N-acetylglucosamine acyltransferase